MAECWVAVVWVKDGVAVGVVDGIPVGVEVGVALVWAAVDGMDNNF